MSASREVSPRRRYGAKLLFQFRVENEDVRKSRICEERIVVLAATSATEALGKAKRKGRRSEYSYTNKNNVMVHFEFLGVRELLCLDPICERGEVWYDIKDYVINKKRLAELIPDEKQLDAIRQ